MANAHSTVVTSGILTDVPVTLFICGLVRECDFRPSDEHLGVGHDLKLFFVCANLCRFHIHLLAAAIGNMGKNRMGCVHACLALVEPDDVSANKRPQTAEFMGAGAAKTCTKPWRGAHVAVMTSSTTH